MPEREKAIFHAIMAAIGAVEALTSKSVKRAAFGGAMAGFHVYAIYDHLNKMKQQTKPARFTQDGQSIN